LEIRQAPSNSQRDWTENCNATLVSRENVADVEVCNGWIGAGNQQRHSHDAADALTEVKITTGG